MEDFDLRQCELLKGILKSPSVINQVAIDSRTISSKQSLFVALEGSRSHGLNYLHHAKNMGAEFALVPKNLQLAQDPSLPTLLHVNDPLATIHAIAHTYRKQMKAKVLCITGSFGKTMLKDLLYACLSTKWRTAASPESFNSQIGVPLSLFEIHENDDIALIEAGISSPGEMKRLRDLIEPDYGIFTTLGRAHLASMHSLQAIAEEKMQLFSGLPKESWLLLPDHPLLKTDTLACQCIHWNRKYEELPFAEIVDLQEYPLRHYLLSFPNGQTNTGTIRAGYPYFLDLVLMAIKAAWLLGVSAENIRKNITDSPLEPMSQEIWCSPQGITYINDSYGKTPLSISKALKQLPDHRKNKNFFIFGGLRGSNNLNFANDPQIDHIFTYRSKIQEVIPSFREKVQAGDTVLIKGPHKIPFHELIPQLGDPISNNCLWINLTAVKNNIEILRTHTEYKQRILAMVKAMAYGTNMLLMTRFLQSCNVDIVGVAHLSEALLLHAAGVEQTIFLLNIADYEVGYAIQLDLEVAVSNAKTISCFEEASQRQGKTTKLHLHVDTGMSRLGCRPQDVVDLARQIQQSPHLKLEGFMTHFAAAENADEDSFTEKQGREFQNLVTMLHAQNIFPRWVHAANTSGSLRFDFPFCNMCRIGLGLYGLQPSSQTKDALELERSLSLSSRIVGINECIKGETVSYGRTYEVHKDRERIAVIPLGYYDGIHRHYSGTGYVLIRGEKAPMVGTITMDFMMVDITNIPKAAIGDHVLIFGQDPHGNILEPEVFTSNANSLIYELITCLGPRIQRVFFTEELPISPG